MGGEESDETIGHWLACSVPEIGELLGPPLGLQFRRQRECA